MRTAIHSTDWAFGALQSLRERYGCPVKYFYTTERISRQEFAINLSVCLNHISKLITSSRANLLTKDDLATIGRLQADFAPELGIWGNQIDLVNRSSNQPGREQFMDLPSLLFIIPSSASREELGLVLAMLPAIASDLQ